MVSAKELMFDAVKYDEPFLAHAIYYGIQKGLITMDTPAKDIPYKQMDLEEVKKITNENILAMNLIKLYSIKIAPNKFAFYLGDNEKLVVEEHQKQYKSKPNKLNDMSNRMDMTLFHESEGKWLSFRQIKDRTLSFPYYVGEFEK